MESDPVRPGDTGGGRAARRSAADARWRGPFVYLDALTPMARSLAAALRADVSTTSRQRGDAYFRAGRVFKIESSAAGFRAIVKGSAAYTVTLALEQNQLEVSCTCPYFSGSFDACKHIWATILAADRDRLMAVPADLWLHMNIDQTLSHMRTDEGFDEFGDALPGS